MLRRQVRVATENPSELPPHRRRRRRQIEAPRFRPVRSQHRQLRREGCPSRRRRSCRGRRRRSRRALPERQAARRAELEQRRVDVSALRACDVAVCSRCRSRRGRRFRRRRRRRRRRRTRRPRNRRDRRRRRSGRDRRGGRRRRRGRRRLRLRLHRLHPVRRRTRSKGLGCCIARQLSAATEAELVVILVLLGALRTGDHRRPPPGAAHARPGLRVDSLLRPASSKPSRLSPGLRTGQGQASSPEHVTDARRSMPPGSPCRAGPPPPPPRWLPPPARPPPDDSPAA